MCKIYSQWNLVCQAKISVLKRKRLILFARILDHQSADIPSTSVCKVFCTTLRRMIWTCSWSAYANASLLNLLSIVEASLEKSILCGGLKSVSHRVKECEGACCPVLALCIVGARLLQGKTCQQRACYFVTEKFAAKHKLSRCQVLAVNCVAAFLSIWKKCKGMACTI